MRGKREPFVVTGPRLVVSLFGQGQRGVLGPVLVVGRGRGRERGGQGRFVGGSHSPRHRAGPAGSSAQIHPSTECQAGHSLGSRRSLWGCSWRSRRCREQS